MNRQPNFTLATKFWVAGVAGLSGLALGAPALAHHPFGGSTPTTAIAAFLSGLGHPVIGLDHLAFVIIVGLLAAVMGLGLMIPIAFTVAALSGNGAPSHGPQLTPARSDDLGVGIAVWHFPGAQAAAFDLSGDGTDRDRGTLPRLCLWRSDRRGQYGAALCLSVGFRQHSNGHRFRGLHRRQTAAPQH
jgi:hypothetical protein